MKKALIGFVVLVVVVLGGALIAPSFIDWNARLPEITAQVKAATGRDLSVDGRLEVRLLPAPMLTVRGVKVGNAPGASAAHMATLDAVEVRVALLPLLSGQVQVQRVRLVKPQIHIETFVDGRTNLEFSAPASAAAPTASVPSGGAPSNDAASTLGVRLDHFEIIDATIEYRDAKTGTVERVEGLDTTLRATSLQGPFEAQGQVRLRGVPVTFDASLGQIIKGRTVPINAVIKAPGGTRVQISGAALEMETAPRFKGKVKAEGTNLAAMLNAITGDTAAPGSLQQPFTLESTVSATAKDVAVRDLDISLGTTRATGEADVGLMDGLHLNVALKATRIDADALLSTASKVAPNSGPSAGISGGAIAPKPPKNGGAANGAGFALPKDINATLAIVVDAVTYKGGLVSNVRLNAELADGELVLSQFQLQAPGVTDMAVFGIVKPEAGKPRFSGDLEVITANPEGLASWLGAKLPGGVAGRLKRVTFKTKVAADASQVALSGVELTGDRTRVTGGVTVALRARPSFGADLRIDALNLDTYANGASKPEPAPVATTPTAPKSSLEQAMDVAGIWASTAVLNDFDANLKLRLGQLVTGGKVLGDVAFDGTLYAGTLDLRHFAVGNALGASATVSGGFNGFGGVPEMTAVKLKTTIKDVNAVADALGATGVPPRFGAASFNVSADGSLLQPRLKADVAALGGMYGAAGRLSLLPIGFGWNGTVTAQHPNADKLLATLGYAASGPLGALDVKAALKSDGLVHEVTAIKGLIGDTALAGSVIAKTGGAKPNVVADMVTGAFDVQRFLAKSDKRADASPALMPGRNPLLMLASTRAPTQVAQAASRADKRWSREAFDLSVLNTVDADVTLKSDAIKFGDYQLDNADIHATVAGGVLNADRVAGRLFGGPVSGRAIVRAQGTPTVESTIKLNAMDVGRAVQAVAGKDLAAGNLGLDLNFNASGFSVADLVSSLSGAGGLNINALDVKKGGTGTALAPVIGLVAAMNQFSLPTPGKPKSGLADLVLSFDIKDGVANAQNLTLNSAFGKGTGAGRVDIAAWAIDFAGTMTVEPNLLTSLLSKGRIGQQQVPFTLKGALDKPGVNLGVRKAGASPAQAPAGKIDPLQGILNQVLPGVLPKQPTPQQPAPQQPAPQQQDGTLAPPPSQQNAAPSTGGQRPLTPEQMIKQLMKGL